MPRTLFKSKTILQPRDDASHYEVSANIINELITMNPAWGKVHMEYRLQIFADGTAEMRLKFVDLKKFGLRDYLLFAAFVTLVYFLFFHTF